MKSFQGPKSETRHGHVLGIKYQAPFVKREGLFKIGIGLGFAASKAEKLTILNQTSNGGHRTLTDGLKDLKRLIRATR